MPDETPHDLRDLIVWGPTSANGGPARFCNLGYGDPASLHPRLSRFEFNEACSLL